MHHPVSRHSPGCLGRGHYPWPLLQQDMEVRASTSSFASSSGLEHSRFEKARRPAIARYGQRRRPSQSPPPVRLCYRNARIYHPDRVRGAFCRWSRNRGPRKPPHCRMRAAGRFIRLRLLGDEPTDILLSRVGRSASARAGWQADALRTLVCVCHGVATPVDGVIAVPRAGLSQNNH